MTEYCVEYFYKTLHNIEVNVKVFGENNTDVLCVSQLLHAWRWWRQLKLKSWCSVCNYIWSDQLFSAKISCTVGTFSECGHQHCNFPPPPPAPEISQEALVLTLENSNHPFKASVSSAHTRVVVWLSFNLTAVGALVMSQLFQSVNIDLNDFSWMFYCFWTTLWDRFLQTVFTDLFVIILIKIQCLHEEDLMK